MRVKEIDFICPACKTTIKLPFVGHNDNTYSAQCTCGLGITVELFAAEEIEEMDDDHE